MDNIDVAAATRRGIPVLYTPGASTNVVAEHTLALLLALLRRIPQEDRQLRSGLFDKPRYCGSELRGKTLGLIGYGRIARRVAELVASSVLRSVTCTTNELIYKDRPILSPGKTAGAIGSVSVTGTGSMNRSSCRRGDSPSEKAWRSGKLTTNGQCTKLRHS